MMPSDHYFCDNFSDSGVGSCSPTSTEPGTPYVPEHQSVQTFRSTEEYLEAMKEDLADWLNCLYNWDIEVDDFFEKLESGVLLCEHANNVQEKAEGFRDGTDEDSLLDQLGSSAGLTHRSKLLRSNLKIPERGPIFKRNVKQMKSFQCRDNIANFISWCRELGIPNVLLFETEDLVNRKNEKSVVLCLLEVARRGSKFGMLVPCLIQMEQEIDAEIKGDPIPPPKAVVPEKFVQIKTCDMRSLDERVRDIVSQCNCPIQFQVIRVSEGKYMVGDNRTLIFVRILRNHVMVRVGGGWDTLENYMNKHDPCRAAGHKPSASIMNKRLASNQNIISDLKTSTLQQDSPRRGSIRQALSTDSGCVNSAEDASSSDSQCSTPRKRSVSGSSNVSDIRERPKSNRPTDLGGGTSSLSSPRRERSLSQTTPARVDTGLRRPASAKTPGRMSPAPSYGDVRQTPSKTTRPQSARTPGRQSPAPFMSPQPTRRRQLPRSMAKTATTPTQRCRSVEPEGRQRSASLSLTEIADNLDSLKQQTSLASLRLKTMRSSSVSSSQESIASARQRAKTPTADSPRHRKQPETPRAKTPNPSSATKTIGSDLKLSKSAQIMKKWKTQDDTNHCQAPASRQRRLSGSSDDGKRKRPQSARGRTQSMENIATSPQLNYDEIQDPGGNAEVYSEMEKLFQEYKEQEKARSVIEDELDKRMEKIKAAVEKKKEEDKQKQQQTPSNRRTSLTSSKTDGNLSASARKGSSPAVIYSRSKTPDPENANRKLVVAPSGALARRPGSAGPSRQRPASPGPSELSKRSSSPAPTRSSRPQSPSPMRSSRPQSPAPSSLRAPSPKPTRQLPQAPSAASKERPQSPAPVRKVTSRPQSPAPGRRELPSRPQSPAPARRDLPARPSSPAPARKTSVTTSSRPQSPAPMRKTSVTERPQSPAPVRSVISQSSRPQSPMPYRKVRPQSPGPVRDSPLSRQSELARPGPPINAWDNTDDSGSISSLEVSLLSDVCDEVLANPRKENRDGKTRIPLPSYKSKTCSDFGSSSSLSTLQKDIDSQRSSGADEETENLDDEDNEVSEIHHRRMSAPDAKQPLRLLATPLTTGRSTIMNNPQKAGRATPSEFY